MKLGSDWPDVARAEEEFGFAEVPVLSFEDLFAGYLREFVSSLPCLSHQSRRFAHSRYCSKAQANRGVVRASVREHEREAGHGRRLERTREDLIAILHGNIGEHEKSFLLSFKRAEPRWDLLRVEHAPDLPAVRGSCRILRQWSAVPGNAPSQRSSGCCHVQG
jgi:hypothetical protein